MSALLLAGTVLGGCVSASPTPSPTRPASGVPSPTATPSPTPIPTPTATASPTPVPLDQAMLGRRFTVLVVGADTSLTRRAAGRSEWRTDALMLVSVSADRYRIDAISIPRDTVDVPMADGTTYHGKINGIEQDDGIEALRGAVSTLLGVPIDRYIRIDMDDFATLVDTVGGIDVTLETRIVDPKVHLDLKAGPTHMGGALALAFSRTRFDNDYGRAARQQEVLLALVRKWLKPSVEWLTGSILALGSLETDITADLLPTLLEIGHRSSSATVTGIVLKPPRFALFAGIEPNSSRGWVMIPNVAEMRRYARAALSD